MVFWGKKVFSLLVLMHSLKMGLKCGIGKIWAAAVCGVGWAGLKPPPGRWDRRSKARSPGRQPSSSCRAVQDQASALKDGFVLPTR